MFCEKRNTAGFGARDDRRDAHGRGLDTYRLAYRVTYRLLYRWPTLALAASLGALSDVSLHTSWQHRLVYRLIRRLSIVSPIVSPTAQNYAPFFCRTVSPFVCSSLIVTGRASPTWVANRLELGY